MPNWCRGIIEIKGKGEDIKRFLLEKLVEDTKEVIDTGTKIIIGLNICMWIEGTGELEFEYTALDN